MQGFGKYCSVGVGG